MIKRICKYKKCKKEFIPKEGYEEYCSSKCWEDHLYEIKKGIKRI